MRIKIPIKITSTIKKFSIKEEILIVKDISHLGQEDNDYIDTQGDYKSYL